MKNIAHHNDLLADQIRSMSNAKLQWQHGIEKEVARRNMPEFKMVLEYSSQQPGNNAKFKKSKLYIKNMVSNRCKIVVQAILENLGLHSTSVELGEIEIMENISVKIREQLNTALQRTGLELLDDHRSIIVEKIRNIIIEMIHYSEELPKIKISDYLSNKLSLSYFKLYKLFSEVQGTTIEHYIITQKIERAKELMAYGELSISEIAYKLHYSSNAHLSKQFKKITGLTPARFKKMKHKKLLSLDSL